MEAWIIVIITISCGLGLFGIIFAFKHRKNKRRDLPMVQPQPVVVVSSVNTNMIPSTSRAPAFNVGNSQAVHQQPTVSFYNPSGVVQFNQQPPPQYAYNPNYQQRYPMQSHAYFGPNMAQEASIHKV